MVSSENKDRLSGNKEQTSPDFDNIEGEKLLRLARSAIEQHLRDIKIRDFTDSNRAARLGAGLFVTLWTVEPTQANKTSPDNLILRGCIGHLQSKLPLYDFIQEVAIAAATHDPRFQPLSLNELNTTRIEIAVLSPFRPITDLQQINIGQDGLMIEGLGKRGLFLPKVATRMGWDQSSFMEGVCKKAGLPRNCWPGTCNLSAFTTLVFTEDETDY